jgi:hypothetical protein
MWNLDDSGEFVRVLSLHVPWPGFTDRERRERLREEALKHFAGVPANIDWWAFRISVRKAGQRAFDIENVPKPIIDAFCAQQIRNDGSRHAQLGL